jgi:NAD-dependent deacetylase
MLPQDAIMTLYRELEQGFDLVFSIGTTSQLPYIANPVRMAAQWGALMVEINPAQTSVSDVVNYKITSGAAETLDRLWNSAQALG